ncbi:hypothetical protein COB52_02775 [Candidatus Kaiserbacteria bacterium]|nr:MAG: hypothetical protein COB52_02775 [Candidatus Kaiserbacteria bacterium]
MKEFLSLTFKLTAIGIGALYLFTTAPTPSETVIEYEAPVVIEEPIPEPVVIEEIIIEEPIVLEPVVEPEPVVEKPKAVPLPQVFYTTPPSSLDELNKTTSKAIVNILCNGLQGSPVGGATGSGVIIDPSGIILTNAHVAQYVLLQENPAARVSCVIRIGAPAKARYTTKVIAFPDAWIQEHAKDIKVELATGTGEHDWALLYITGRTDGSEKPKTYPYVPFDARMGVAQTGDPVLLSGYPAGFLGGVTLQRDLWPVSTIVSIQKVFTFVTSTIDIISLGGNIIAQGGSSGGGVINQWGYLVGIIVTSSVADVTADRDLRAVTLSHISTSFSRETGKGLFQYLDEKDFDVKLKDFQDNTLPSLLEYYPL